MKSVLWLIVLLGGGAVVWMLSRTVLGNRSNGSSTHSDAGDALGFSIRLERLTRRPSPSGSPVETSLMEVVPVDAKGESREVSGIEISVNGVPLRYAVSSGNYYDRHPRFKPSPATESEVAPGMSYRFTVRRADGQEEPLAEVLTPQAVTIDQLTVPRTCSRGRDVEVRYKGIAQPMELCLFRTQTYLDERGNEVILSGSSNAPETIRKSIRGDGSLVIPASFLEAKPGQRVLSIGLEWVARTQGTVHPAGGKLTTIESVETVEMGIEVSH